MRAVLGITLLLLAACSIGTQPANGGRVVTVMTHDSFVIKPDVQAAFTSATGITIKQLTSGDAGALTNKLILTKDSPLADVAVGVDSNYASRALSEEVFAEYDSPAAVHGADRYQLMPTNRLHAVDVGDVCVNIDNAAFADRPAPKNYADLINPEYRDQLVVEDPATSSPGLAFLLGSIAAYGEPGWQDYWTSLKNNGVRVVSGWEEAYNQDFSGSSGQGDKPMVVSYASSPAAEINDNGQPRTTALLDTCYRQVEYAGILAGAKNRSDAEEVIDFLLSQDFQATVAEQMYVYPTRDGVALPESWRAAAPLPNNSASLPADQVNQNRERWVAQWRDLMRA